MPAKHCVWFEDQHDLMEALACTIRELAVLVREGRQNHSFGIRYPRGCLYFAFVIGAPVGEG
jgi:UDP-N-acetylglucosamine pyrophosphorylase